MARKQRVSKYVVLNRDAVDAIRLGYADGLQVVAERIVSRAEAVAPDAPPLGVGLRLEHGAVTYVDGKKVAGNGTAPRGWAPKVIGALFGFSFPGRFQEVGTQHQPARPFLTPSAQAELGGGLGGLIAYSIKRRLGLVR